MVNKIKSCVIISGNGSNLKQLINNSRDYSFPLNIKLVISNNINAKGLKFENNLIYLSNISLLIIEKYLKEIAF